MVEIIIILIFIAGKIEVPDVTPRKPTRQILIGMHSVGELWERMAYTCSDFAGKFFHLFLAKTIETTTTGKFSVGKTANDSVNYCHLLLISFGLFLRQDTFPLLFRKILDINGK